MNDPVGAALPRLLIIGPMVGRFPGFVTTQGEVLSDLLKTDGVSVLEKSPIPNRYLRAADILWGMLHWRSLYDVVFLQAYGGPSFVLEDTVTRIAGMLKKPVVMVLRGGAFIDFMDRYPGWSHRVLSRAECLVTPSEFLARPLRSRGFLPSVVPNVLALERYPFRLRKDPRPRILWMRTFHPVWNPELAMKTFLELLKRRPDAVIVMAGQDKGLEEKMKHFAVQSGIEHAVTFPGFLNFDQKIREFERADVFLSTNRVDNTPVAVIEACACGLPVVSTSVGGVPDLITDQVDGLLADQNPRALAATIERVFDEKGLSARLSLNARRLAEGFAWEVVSPAWHRILRCAWIGQRVERG
jgi:glycosyltransferase involved in cell wall biosynthesis